MKVQDFAFNWVLICFNLIVFSFMSVSAINVSTKEVLYILWALVDTFLILLFSGTKCEQ